MRKNIFGRQFKRDANERKALFKGLLSSLVLHTRIETTEAKAKAIKGQIDKLITNARKHTEKNTLNKLLSLYLTREAMEKLVKEVAPSFTNRVSGYTRLLHTRKRVSDNASMVIMEFVERDVVISQEEKPAKKTKIKQEETKKPEEKTEKKVKKAKKTEKTEK